MAVSIRDRAFDPWAEIEKHQNAHTELRGKFGATSIFVGTMRDFNEATDVRAMTLEHYAGMTERHLEAICESAIVRWNLLEALVIHRVGDLQPADPIVLVAVWSAHRAAAFEASRYIMEDLKSHAPFWKKEMLKDGHRWVANNTPGHTTDAD